MGGDASSTSEVKTTLENGASLNRWLRRPLQSKAVVAGAVAMLLGSVLLSLFLLNRFIIRDAGAEPDGGISVTELPTGDDVHGPVISHNGRYFVYRKIDGEDHSLVLQQVGQSTPLEILSTTTLRLYGKTFSPDDSYIYFTAREASDSQLSVYRISTFGGAPRKILSGISDASSISFSPDGNEFVFARTKSEIGPNSITIARTDGSSQRDIIASDSDFFSYPAWSPDRRLIAYSRFDSEHRFLETINLTDRRVSPVLDESLDSCYQIAWTPDGNALVFNGTILNEAMTARRDQVWLVTLATRKLVRLTPEGIRYTFGGLSDEGTAIVGTVDRQSQIWVMDASGDSRTAIQLTTGRGDGRSGLSPLPDGRVGYLTRNGDNWEIWVMNADGSSATQLFNDLPVIDELRATPDGRFFLFNAPVNRTYNLFRLNVDGSELRQLTSGTAYWVGDPAPSADSRWVLCPFQELDPYGVSTLRRISIDGGDFEALPGVSGGTQVAHYSPDGKLISYVDEAEVPPKLRVIATDGTPVRTFDVEPDSVLNVGAMWTPDSRSLAYIVYKNKVSNIWLQPLDRGARRRRLTDFTSGHIYRIAYSADGKKIYLARGHAKNGALLIKGFIHKERPLIFGWPLLTVLGWL
jgi:Tol biopolymer transport system component